MICVDSVIDISTPGIDSWVQPTIMEILFWDFLSFYQIFFSPKVKQSMIISNKQGVYELPHELPNNLRLRILGNKEKLGKSQKLLE